ncbi:MAG: hypothetical protein WC659_06025 [Patescibacteria group bacterium]
MNTTVNFWSWAEKNQNAARELTNIPSDWVFSHIMLGWVDEFDGRGRSFYDSHFEATAQMDEEQALEDATGLKRPILGTPILGMQEWIDGMVAFFASLKYPRHLCLTFVSPDEWNAKASEHLKKVFLDTAFPERGACEKYLSFTGHFIGPRDATGLHPTIKSTFWTDELRDACRNCSGLSVEAFETNEDGIIRVEADWGGGNGSIYVYAGGKKVFGHDGCEAQPHGSWLRGFEPPVMEKMRIALQKTLDFTKRKSGAVTVSELREIVKEALQA